MSSTACTLEFACDDRAGFALRIVHDHGDFWLSVVPVLDDLAREHMLDDEESRAAELDRYAACYSATIRVRTPMIGGGSHDKLWHALARVFRETPTDGKDDTTRAHARTKPRRK